MRRHTLCVLFLFWIFKGGVLMKKSRFFFCYSVQMFKFLKMDKGVNYICYAIHDKTKKPFWLFERDNALQNALIEYNDIYK